MKPSKKFFRKLLPIYLSYLITGNLYNGIRDKKMGVEYLPRTQYCDVKTDKNFKKKFDEELKEFEKLIKRKNYEGNCVTLDILIHDSVKKYFGQENSWVDKVITSFDSLDYLNKYGIKFEVSSIRPSYLEVGYLKDFNYDTTLGGMNKLFLQADFVDSINKMGKKGDISILFLSHNCKAMIDAAGCADDLNNTIYLFISSKDYDNKWLLLHEMSHIFGAENRSKGGIRTNPYFHVLLDPFYNVSDTNDTIMVHPFFESPFKFAKYNEEKIIKNKDRFSK